MFKSKPGDGIKGKGVRMGNWEKVFTVKQGQSRFSGIVDFFWRLISRLSHT